MVKGVQIQEEWDVLAWKICHRGEREQMKGVRDELKNLSDLQFMMLKEVMLNVPMEFWEKIVWHGYKAGAKVLGISMGQYLKQYVHPRMQKIRVTDKEFRDLVNELDPSETVSV